MAKLQALLLLVSLLPGCRLLDGSLSAELKELNQGVRSLNERVGTPDGCGLAHELSKMSAMVGGLGRALDGSQGLINRIEKLSDIIVTLGGNVSRLQDQVLVLEGRLENLSELVGPSILRRDLEMLSIAVASLKNHIDESGGLNDMLAGKDGLNVGLGSVSNSLVTVGDRLVIVDDNLKKLSGELGKIAGGAAGSSVLDGMGEQILNVKTSLEELNAKIGVSDASVEGLFKSIKDLSGKLDHLSKAIGAAAPKEIEGGSR